MPSPPKCFSSHRHHAFSIWFRHMLLITQIGVDQRSIVVSDRLAFSSFREQRNLARNQDEKCFTTSPWLPELNGQAPEAFQYNAVEGSASSVRQLRLKNIQHFSNSMTLVHKIAMKWIIYARTVCTELRLGAILLLSTLFLDARTGMSFKNTFVAATAFSLSAISESVVKAYPVYKSSSHGRASWKHTKFFWDETNLRC